MLGRTLWTFAVAAALGLLAPCAAYACSCAPPPPPGQAMDLAGAVFEGRVLSRDVLPETGEVMFTFDVQFTWKGDVTDHVTVRTAPTGAGCGRHFLMGKTYMVYASATDRGLWDDLCSRTRGRERADEDRDVLGPGRNPRSLPPSAKQTPREPPRIEPPVPDDPPVHEPGTRGCGLIPQPIGVPGLLIVALAIARRRKPA